jgi:hypothetical protein
MTTRIGNFDPEIANLDGGLFGYLPRQEMPLSAFGLHGKVIEPVDATTSRYRRATLDSLAPTAFLAAMDRDAPQASRPAPWLSGAVVAASAVALVATALIPSLGLLQARTGAHSAAVTQVAEPPVAPTPVPAAVPAPAETAAAPVIAPAPAKIPAKTAAAPRAMAAAPARAAAPAPAPFSTADLPDLSPAPMPEIPAAPKPPEVPFARASAAVAIASAGMAAGSCRDAGAGPLAVQVSVTFAPSGHASAATVDGGPMAGNAGGSCLSWALRGAKVPAFDGEPVVVHTTVHLR